MTMRTLPFVMSLAAVSLLPMAVMAQEGAAVPPAATPPAGDAPATPIFGTIDSVSGLSQDQLPPEVKILQSIEKEIKAKYKKQVYTRSQVPSLFFTTSQYALLREARVGFNTRVPTMQDLKDSGDPNDPNYRPPRSLREVSLAGILYNKADDWVIYMNGTRITPDAIPAEVVDIKVYKEYIEMKWYDQATAQIYPIRLRPNQRFNIDSKIFLPGRTQS